MTNVFAIPGKPSFPRLQSRPEEQHADKSNSLLHLLQRMSGDGNHRLHSFRTPEVVHWTRQGPRPVQKAL